MRAGHRAVGAFIDGEPHGEQRPGDQHVREEAALLVRGRALTGRQRERGFLVRGEAGEGGADAALVSGRTGQPLRLQQAVEVRGVGHRPLVARLGPESQRQVKDFTVRHAPDAIDPGSALSMSRHGP